MHKKKPELNYPQMEIENFFCNAIDVKQRQEEIFPDVFPELFDALQTESFLYKINKPHSPFEMGLCLPTQKGFTIVKLEEVVYCQAQRSYTQFHLFSNKSITVSKPLLEYDKLLTDTTFCRVHKSFFINLLHVKEYIRGEGGTVIMSNGLELDVSRRKKEQFLIKIKEFFKF